MQRVLAIVLGLSSVSLAACAPTVRSHAYVARSSAASAPLAATPVVVMRPRVCLERFRPRPMSAPERAESLAVQTLLDAVTDRLPGLGDAAPVATRCPVIVDVGRPDDDLGSLRASPEVLEAMHARAGKSALVVEIAGRVTCNIARRRGAHVGGGGGRAFGDDGAHCYEDDVQISAFLFDREGRVVRAARRQVAYAEDAREAVDEVLGVVQVPRRPVARLTCRMNGGVADCT
ncbi:MAG: hypothetical protein R3B36_00855 [Polyangiaceae bacterium]